MPHKNKERWEELERYVLLAVGLCLLACAIWLLVFSGNPARLAFLVLLLPCLFWVVWQALYEDKLGTAEPVSVGERFMHGTYLWVRRIVLGATSILFGFLTWYAAQQGAVLSALFCAALTFVAGRVAMYGGGVHKSMSDDVAVDRQRTDRYK